MEKIGQLLARILLGHIFLLAGISKLSAIEGTQGYMEMMGVPGILVYPVIALEILGGLAIIAGLFTRMSAVLLGGFTLLAALIFHNNLGDQMQMILFMKNLAITGGLLLLAIHGAGAYSLDNRKAGHRHSSSALAH